MDLLIFNSIWASADFDMNLYAILNFGVLIAWSLEQNGIGLANWIRFYFYSRRCLVLIQNGRQYDVTVRFKDTHREKVPSNKTPALTKSTNMGIWVVGTWNQGFIRGS